MAEEACRLLSVRFRSTGGGMEGMVDLYDEAHDLFDDAADLDRRYDDLADATRGARDNSSAVARAVRESGDIAEAHSLSDEMGELNARMAAGCTALGVDVPATAFDQ